jgi:hypothetical protein
VHCLLLQRCGDGNAAHPCLLFYSSLQGPSWMRVYFIFFGQSANENAVEIVRFRLSTEHYSLFADLEVCGRTMLLSVSLHSNPCMHNGKRSKVRIREET